MNFWTGTLFRSCDENIIKNNFKLEILYGKYHI